MSNNKMRIPFLLFIGFVMFILASPFILDFSYAESTWNVWDYDQDDDGSISINEVMCATNHYHWGGLSERQIIEVFRLYFEV